MKIHLVDTGMHTQTGGRLKRLVKWLSPGETFLFTYGDGVADVDLNALVRFHNAHGKLATVTAVHTPARFGRMAIGPKPGSTAFLEKLEKVKDGLTAVFSYSIARPLNTSTTMKVSGRRKQSNGSHKTGR